MQYDHCAIIRDIATILIWLTMAVEINSGQRQPVETPLMCHSNLVDENDPDTGGRGGKQHFNLLPVHTH